MPNLFDQINPTAALSNEGESSLSAIRQMMSLRLTEPVSMMTSAASVVDSTSQNRRDPYNIAGSKGALARAQK